MWPPEDHPQRVDPAPWLQLEEQRPRRGNHQTGDSCNILRHGQYIILVTRVTHVTCYTVHRCGRCVCPPPPRTTTLGRPRWRGGAPQHRGGCCPVCCRRWELQFVLHILAIGYWMWLSMTRFEISICHHKLKPLCLAYAYVWILVLLGGRFTWVYCVHQNICTLHS